MQAVPYLKNIEQEPGGRTWRIVQLELTGKKVLQEHVTEYQPAHRMIKRHNRRARHGAIGRDI